MSSANLQRFGDLGPEIKEVLISTQALQQRVNELGQAISQDYAGKNPLLVGVLKGVVIFMADLLRAITIPVELDFLALSKYSNQPSRARSVRLEKDLSTTITGREVLFVVDMVDTGLSLNYLLKTVRTRQPTSLEVCAMFNKPAHRLIELPLRYKGFDLDDRIVAGYGLAYQEKYRNLPFLALLSAQALHNHKTNS
jgi:hypoxanthine phosphoribosyltransferase